MEPPIPGAWLFVLAAAFGLVVFSLPLIFYLIVKDAPKTPERLVRVIVSLLVYLVLLILGVRYVEKGNQLAAAVKEGDPQKVQFLLDKGISANACGFEGCPVDLAIKYERWEVLQVLANRGALPVEHKRPGGKKSTTADDLDKLGMGGIADALRENERRAESQQ